MNEFDWFVDAMFMTWLVGVTYIYNSGQNVWDTLAFYHKTAFNVVPLAPDYRDFNFRQ